MSNFSVSPVGLGSAFHNGHVSILYVRDCPIAMANNSVGFISTDANPTVMETVRQFLSECRIKFDSACVVTSDIMYNMVKEN